MTAVQVSQGNKTTFLAWTNVTVKIKISPLRSCPPPATYEDMNVFHDAEATFGI